ncbi:MAG: hypothetical protein KA496_02960, partial [Thauera sp.]|nr:hypothetical protein [Thauera sp.]
NCPQAQTPPRTITGRRFHSAAGLCRPSHYVIIGTSNRVTTLNYPAPCATLERPPKRLLIV